MVDSGHLDNEVLDLLLDRFLRSRDQLVLSALVAASHEESISVGRDGLTQRLPVIEKEDLAEQVLVTVRCRRTC